MASAFAGLPKAGGQDQGGARSLFLAENIREAVQADEAFALQVCDNDPVKFEAFNKMPARVVLSVCEAYLRRVAAQISAAKAKPKRHG